MKVIIKEQKVYRIIPVLWVKMTKSDLQVLAPFASPHFWLRTLPPALVPIRAAEQGGYGVQREAGQEARVALTVTGLQARCPRLPYEDGSIGAQDTYRSHEMVGISGGPWQVVIMFCKECYLPRAPVLPPNTIHPLGSLEFNIGWGRVHTQSVALV